MGLLDFFNASVTLKLDNAYVVPGGSVSGIISIQVKKSIEVHGLHLILRGKEEVTVNPYSTKNREYHSTIILNQRVNFHGGKSTKDIRNVPLGNYEYPFICPLPHDIPCTTNTRSFGSITKLSYSATAVLCIPTSPDIEVSEKFHVLSVCSQEQLKTQMPNHSNGTSHLTSCCCINKGTIKWNATLIQKLCVMGVDNFLIKLDVNNESQCKIDKVSVNLTQKTFIYRNCHHYDDVENIVRESLDFHVSPQTSGTLKIGFRVPFGLAPSKNSGLFSLQYYVKLKINVKDGSDVKIKLPVYLVEAVDETGKIPIISLEPGAVENLPHCQPQEFSYQNMNQREAPISRPMPGPASTGNTLNPPHAHNNPQIHPQIAARPINTFSAKAQYDTVPYTDKVSLELEQDRFPVEYVME